MLRYALEVVGGVDLLAVTCLDRLQDIPRIQVCRRYRHAGCTVERIARSAMPRSLTYQEQLTRTLLASDPVLEPVPDAAGLLPVLAADLGVPVGLISTGPTAGDKRWLQSG